MTNRGELASERPGCRAPACYTDHRGMRSKKSQIRGIQHTIFLKNAQKRFLHVEGARDSSLHEFHKAMSGEAVSCEHWRQDSLQVGTFNQLGAFLARQTLQVQLSRFIAFCEMAPFRPVIYKILFALLNHFQGHSKRDVRESDNLSITSKFGLGLSRLAYRWEAAKSSVMKEVMKVRPQKKTRGDTFSIFLCRELPTKTDYMPLTR